MAKEKVTEFTREELKELIIETVKEILKSDSEFEDIIIEIIKEAKRDRKLD